VTSSRSHRSDEFPAEYSLASCSPAELASAFSATYHAATNNPVRLLNGSERFNGTFTSVSVEGVTPRVRPEILQQKYGVELTGTKGSKPLVNWVLWSTLGKTRVIEGTLIELCGTAAGLS
jgi:hypothetical protein